MVGHVLVLKTIPDVEVPALSITAANDTDRPRHAPVINVFHYGVRSDSEAPPLEGTTATTKGQPIGGRFFPLLVGP